MMIILYTYLRLYFKGQNQISIVSLKGLSIIGT